MGFIEEMTILPPPAHLPLLGYVLLATILVHVPYMVLLLGCVMGSLHFHAIGKWTGDGRYTRLAADLVDAIAERKALALALGFVPQVVILFTLAQLFFERGIFRYEIHVAASATSFLKKRIT